MFLHVQYRIINCINFTVTIAKLLHLLNTNVIVKCFPLCVTLIGGALFKITSKCCPMQPTQRHPLDLSKAWWLHPSPAVLH